MTFTTKIEHERLVTFLSQPAAYGEPSASIEVCETHISLVFLTERFAYKLKKPLKFDFLDFSTPQKRRHACEEELRLNRRLAPDVYLDVVPVTAEEQGDLQLGGGGPPVDWLVKMRRLPDDRNLEQLIEAGNVKSQQLDRIAAVLSEFYEQLAPVAIGPDTYRRTFEHHIRDNRDELLQPDYHLPAALVKRVHAAQLQFLRLAPGVFDGRTGPDGQADGRIVDGHGDLRPEHIYLTPEPVMIDCIEFNSEFRRIDVADELCFLQMECEMLCAGTAGERIARRCLQALGDDPPQELLDFYKSYRACVRAKVTALRSEQMPRKQEIGMVSRAQQYLELADAHARGLRPPLLILVRGLMGTGKSTLADALAGAIGAEHVQTDAIRRELFGASNKPAGYNQHLYREENRRAVYDAMLDRAEKLLADGIPVILDGTFFSAALQWEATALAQPLRADALIVNCQCPDELALERIAARRQAGDTMSEARPELLEKQKADQQATPSGISSVTVDTTRSVKNNVDAVLRMTW